MIDGHKLFPHWERRLRRRPVVNLLLFAAGLFAALTCAAYGAVNLAAGRWAVAAIQLTGAALWIGVLATEGRR